MSLKKTENKKFGIVSRNGYRISEVDSFLAKVNSLKGKSVTEATSKITNAQFTLTKWKGYDPKEVDTYLDEMIVSTEISRVEVKIKNPLLKEKQSTENTADRDSRKPIITSRRLRELTPPIVEGIGYEKSEVDEFLTIVADTIQAFEEATGNDLDQLKADQYMRETNKPKLLAGDQVRWALFTVNEGGGYDMRGVDAAVNRLADALDFHWRRKG